VLTPTLALRDAEPYLAGTPGAVPAPYPAPAREARPAPGNQGWLVVDLGTDNGIQVNGQDVPSGGSVPLHDGDRMHLGAWTQITISRA
jgi:hypothetical protein